MEQNGNGREPEWWYTSTVSVTEEAEAGASLELQSLKPAWAMW